jgi:hypothetical protein
MMYKLLAARPLSETQTSLEISLPDTLVFNDNSGIPDFWLQSNE